MRKEKLTPASHAGRAAHLPCRLGGSQTQRERLTRCGTGLIHGTWSCRDSSLGHTKGASNITLGFSCWAQLKGWGVGQIFSKRFIYEVPGKVIQEGVCRPSMFQPR